jgi:hypothetical protein
MAVTRCLVIVPHDQASLCARLTEHFAARADVTVRLDGRTGDGALDAVEVFAAGGGDLDPAVRADVEATIHRLA